MNRDPNNLNNQADEDTPSRSQNDSKWEFCPRCGNSLPSLDHIKFCMNCGLDLEYIKQYGSLPIRKQLTPFIERTILTDEEIITNRDKKLWGIFSSVGLPIGAFILILILEFVVLLIVLLPFLLSPATDPSDLYDLIESPFIINASTLLELLFLLIPVLLVGRYLKNSHLNNRIKLLGVYNDKKTPYFVLKEVLIGLGFAVVGYILVNAVSILSIEIYQFFNPGLEGLEDAYFSSEGIPINLMDLIIMMVLMILVVGPSEEIMFRGFMQKGLDRYFGTKWSLIFVAIYFTFFHVFFYLVLSIDLFLLLFFPYIVISLMLGALYKWRKENLIACIICHGVYNALTILIAFLIY